MQQLMTLSLVAGVIVSGCGHSWAEAQLNAVKPAIVLNSSGSNAAKKEVVILYANETSPTEVEMANYRSIIKVLSDGRDSETTPPAGKDKLSHAIQSLDNDLQVFHTEIADNARELAESICKPAAGSRQGMIVFTNKMTREGTLSYCLPGQPLASDEDARRMAASMAPVYAALKGDFIAESNPLSTLGMLNAALTVTRQVFAAEEYEYVLITSSHGSERFVLAPKLQIDASKIDPAELVRQIAARPSSTPADGTPRIGKLPDIIDQDGRQLVTKDGRFLVSKDGRALVDKDGRVLLDKDGRLLLDKDGRADLEKDGRVLVDKDGRVALDKDGRILLDKDGRALLDKDGRVVLDKDGRLVLEKDGRDAVAIQLDPAAKRVGVEKLQLLDAIGGTSPQGLFFRVVYLDSCKSFLDELAPNLAAGTASNVGRIYTTDYAGIEYRNVEYKGFVASSVLFGQWLTSYLDQKAKEGANITPSGR